MLKKLRYEQIAIAFCCACLLLLATSCDSPVVSNETEIVDDPNISNEEIKVEDIRSDWRLFRGDSLATGVAHTKLPDQPELLWKYEVENGAFEGTAAIVDDIVYIGDLDGHFFAFHLKSGEKIWEQNFSEKKWTFEDGKPVAEEDDTELSGFLASPAVQDDLIYIGDMFGRFFCLDAKTGEPKWGFESQAEIDSSANFYKDNVVVGSQDATLYCRNAKSGEPVWQHQIEDQIRCSPTIVGDRTFVAGCDSRLHTIDLNKGEPIGDGVSLEAPTMATPAVLGDNVYFGTEGGALFCINWKESETAWTFTDEESSQSMRSSPAVIESHAVFGGRSKKVYAVDPENGDQLWTFTTKASVDSSPVIVGERVFVGSSDGRVYGLNLADGKKVWEYEAGGGFTASPAIANGCLVIANDRGVLYCFGKKE